MTEQERDEKIVDILTKIVIGTLTNNLFERNGEKQLQEILDALNLLPIDDQYYSRANSSHTFLQKQAAEYVEKTKAFNEKYQVK
jgi:hypothetical protein